MDAAYVEPVLSAGHGDVKQAPVFFVGADSHRLQQRFAGGIPVGRAGGPQRQIAVPQDRRPVARLRHRVRQHDDRCLQPLRTVHRHHPHLVAAGLLEIPFDRHIAGLDPVQEPLQRAGMAALVGQGEVEELVDRVIRIGTQPCQHAFSPVAAGRCGCGKDAGVQLEGRTEVDPCQEVRQPVPDGAVAGLGSGHLIQPLPDRSSAAIPGQREQIVVIEPDQRPLEHGGQREVVLRQQQEPAERNEVHHGDLVGQNHAVDAGHRNAQILQAAHQCLEECGAGPDEHHNIARAHLAAPRPEALSADPSADPVRQQTRQPTGGVVASAALDRQAPGRLVLALAGPDRRPQFDPPRMADPMREMMQRRVRLDDPARRTFSFKDKVDRFQHGFCRAKRRVELDRPPQRATVDDAPREMIAHATEFLRIGVLEAEDRLLDVADGEDRACHVAAPLTGEELLGEADHHLPLLRARVLRLVDQDMVDSAVQLVQDPRCDSLPVEQLSGQQDQIVVVEARDRSFRLRIGVQQRVAQLEQRRRGLRRDNGAPAVPDPDEPVALFVQDIDESRQRRPDRPGGDRALCP